MEHKSLRTIYWLHISTPFIARLRKPPFIAQRRRHLVYRPVYDKLIYRSVWVSHLSASSGATEFTKHIQIEMETGNGCDLKIVGVEYRLHAPWEFHFLSFVNYSRPSTQPKEILQCQDCFGNPFFRHHINHCYWAPTNCQACPWDGTSTAELISSSDA